MSEGARILCIEDEDSIAMAIEDALLDAGMAVQMLPDTRAANRCLAEWHPQVLILDRMLPSGDGLEWLQAQRRQGWQTPCLILSARGQEHERCDGLEAGADDYLGKPFSPRELLARITAILRRCEHAGQTRYRLGSVTVDLDARRVGDKDLSEREIELLAYLIQHRKRLVTRAELLERLWGYPQGSARSRAVDMCLSGLRRKMGTSGEAIVTIRGGGYRLDGPCDPIPAS